MRWDLRLTLILKKNQSLAMYLSVNYLWECVFQGLYTYMEEQEKVSVTKMVLALLLLLIPFFPPIFS